MGKQMHPYQVRMQCELPYSLQVPDGAYEISNRMLTVEKSDRSGRIATLAYSIFESPEQTREGRETIAEREANRLIKMVNHLLRWYRTITRIPTILELTRAAASPFSCLILPKLEPWVPPLTFEPSPLEYRNLESSELGGKLRKALAGGNEPDVADLNLLDAEHAIRVGRFREAVLLSWGAIDSTFVRRFNDLVNTKMADDWSDTRDFLKGVDFGLRHKMTSGLRFVADKSVYRDWPELWPDLSNSYRKRNGIIHSGDSATEEDAELAVSVAQRLVDVVHSLDP